MGKDSRKKADDRKSTNDESDTSINEWKTWKVKNGQLVEQLKKLQAKLEIQLENDKKKLKTIQAKIRKYDVK